MNTNRIADLFLRVTGGALIIVGLAKGASAFGSAVALDMYDPITTLTFRQLFIGVGGAELIIGVLCLKVAAASVRALMVVWLSSAFIAYRVGLFWVGYSGPCHCLGTLTDALNLNVDTADSVLKMVLGRCSWGAF